MPDSLYDMLDPYEANAARTRRRAPTREPDPRALYASQGGVSWEKFLPSEQRAMQSAASLQAGGDYNPRDVLLSAIGAVGAPAMGPAQGGATLGSGAVKPIRAYHGSPHDFERFDLSKIGTGEGAQAYGHGLYFAENPAVAKEYRDVLTRRPVNDAGIDPAVAGGAVFDIAAKSGDLINGKIPFGPTRSLLTRDEIVSGFQQGKYSPFDLSPAMQRQIVDQIKPPGHMYEVDIRAQPEQFLDWDKQLTAQPQAVQELISKIPQIARQQKFQTEFLGPEKGMTGSGIYRAASQEFPNVASETMREAGIPGIKYLDQGSRGAKEGTSNYVLFRDDIIDIVKKYGLAGAAAMYGISQDEAKAAMEEPKTTIGRQSYGDEE